jgi:hypothetical protein
MLVTGKCSREKHDVIPDIACKRLASDIEHQVSMGFVCGELCNRWHALQSIVTIVNLILYFYLDHINRQRPCMLKLRNLREKNIYDLFLDN